ncbi:MAG: TIGR00730 family Rossman fold protein [Lentimicrobiaceae bacterium]|nr:TIGR00730 family Rossman fold protein [Lentimicrobiaceae bacterium]
MKTICVFCGSSMGSRPVYREKAREFGKLLARKNIDLVYGGSNIGLMRVLADTVMEFGSKAIGVMPDNLVKREVAHRGITKLHIVGSMHERKALMAELSDAFVVFPGGFGTLDEMFEMLTWIQLNLVEKPCGILNINGYYDQLLQFLDHCVEEQFIRFEHRANVIVDTDMECLLEKLLDFQPTHVEKWIDRLKEMG